MATISEWRAVGFFSFLASTSIDSTVHDFVIACTPNGQRFCEIYAQLNMRANMLVI